jgi:putative membrane protein
MMRSILNRFLIGVSIGVANLVPGVSGGTIAVVFKVYDGLIAAINGFFTDTQKRGSHFVLLANIGSGALFGVVAFSYVIDFALTDYPSLSYAFFLGLIVGSMPTVYRQHTDMRLTSGRVCAGIVGFIVVFITFLLPLAADKTIATLTLDPSTIFFLLLSGFLAASAMIVPGISGSFLLLLLGTYPVLLQAITERHFGILSLVGIGAVLGIVLVSKWISYALKLYPATTYYGILGLMLGSLPALWPGLAFDLGGVTIVMSFLLGLTLVLLFSRLSKN